MTDLRFDFLIRSTWLQLMIHKSHEYILIAFILCNSSSSSCSCIVPQDSLNVVWSISQSIEKVFFLDLRRTGTSGKDCSLDVGLLHLLLRSIEIFSAEQGVLFVIVAELFDRERCVAKWAGLLLLAPLLDALRVKVVPYVAG